MSRRMTMSDMATAAIAALPLLWVPGCYVHSHNEWTVYEGNVPAAEAHVRVRQLKLKYVDDVVTYVEYQDVAGQRWELRVSSDAKYGGCWWITREDKGQISEQAPLRRLSEEEVAQLLLSRQPPPPGDGDALKP